MSMVEVEISPYHVRWKKQHINVAAYSHPNKMHNFASKWNYMLWEYMLFHWQQFEASSAQLMWQGYTLIQPFYGMPHAAVTHCGGDIRFYFL